MHNTGACMVLAWVTWFLISLVLSLLQNWLFNHFDSLSEHYRPEESNFRTLMVFYDCSNERFFNRKAPVTEGYIRLKVSFDLTVGYFYFPLLSLLWKQFERTLRSSTQLSAKCCLSDFLIQSRITEPIKQMWLNTKNLCQLNFWLDSRLFLWCNTINHPLRTDSSSGNLFKLWSSPEVDNCVIDFLKCEVMVLFYSFTTEFSRYYLPMLLLSGVNLQTFPMTCRQILCFCRWHFFSPQRVGWKPDSNVLPFRYVCSTIF